MRAVEHRPLRLGNPGASRSALRGHDADASAANAPHGPDGRSRSAGSGWRSRAGRHHGLCASRLGRNSGCLGRSGCTAPPAGGSVRTGTAVPVGPCAPRRTEGAGRTRPSGAKLHWHRLHRHGVGRGTVTTSSPASGVAAASTYFGVSAVVFPARHVRPRCPPTPLPVGAAILAALQGGQDGKHLINDPGMIQRRNQRRHARLQNRHLTVE